MFENGWFWAALLILFATFHVVDPRHTRVRAAALGLISAVVLVVVLDIDPWSLAVLAAAVACVPVGLHLTRSLAKERPNAAALVVLAPVLAAWITGKLAFALELTPARALFFVGFSFFLIKAWTTIKDVQDGRLQRPDPIVFVALSLCFPTYVAGPMHYYGELEETLRKPARLDGSAIVDIVFRVLLGLFKIRVLTPLLKPLSLDALATGEVAFTPVTLVGASIVYSAVIWSDFSGYSDLAIATTRAVGVRTPENFAWPYAATSVRDFWQRWHITFSRVLTSYVFVPVTRALTRKMADKPRVVMVLGYIATFLFCGYWHGATANFLIWGLVHALAFIAYDLYRPWATKRRLKHRAARGASGGGRALAIRGASIAGTFLFVSLAWIFFVLPLPVLVEKLRW